MSLKLDETQRRLVEILPELGMHQALIQLLKEQEALWWDQARNAALAYALRSDSQDETRRKESLEYNGRANGFRWLREKLEDIVKQQQKRSAA